MTESQIAMLRHTTGADKKAKDRGYRNHYCTNVNNPDAQALVAMGLFVGPQYQGEVGEGNGMFFATEKAFALLGFKEKK